MEGPLHGIRVVDLTRIIAGPFCTALLADMGAEVVKVEPRDGGDPLRSQGTLKDGLSWYFASFNRNKKSLTLDLYTDEGKAVLAELVRRSDVVVENYRAGVIERMGFGIERLRALKPDVILCSINGYGSSGPYVDRPAFDFIAQAMSGFMSVTGEREGAPVRAANPISDLVAGLYAAFGVVCALHARERGGGGQRVEATLMGSMVSLLAYLLADHLATGEVPTRTGNDHPVAAPYGLFQAADKPVAIAPATERYLAKLLEVLELQPLAEHPQFWNRDWRRANRAALNAAITERIRTRTRDEWVEILNRAGVPAGPVQDVAEVAADPQVADQEWIVEIDHPGYGPVRMSGPALKLSSTPAAVRAPAPRLGEHAEEILAGLGYDEAAIARLRAAGIV
jgi:CoA:oxalate CoA-transferase